MSAGPIVPRSILIGAGVLIAWSLALATSSRVFGVESAVPVSTPVASIDVRFTDQPDKTVLATEAVSGRALASYATNTNGFLRATLRGMVGERLRSKGTEAPETPFRVTSWADGRLTLEDLETGRKLELEAFGISNEAAFAALLPGRQLSASTAERPVGIGIEIR